MRNRHIYTSLILLILTFSGLFGITTAANAQEVHALLIIIGDREIGKGVDKNRALIMNMLKQLSDDCTVKLTVMQSKNDYQGEISKITYVNHKSRERKTTEQDIIESQQVAEWLANLRPKPQDTVLIYYTGHGEIDAFGTHKLIFDPGVNMDTPDRAKLSQQLKAKRARLRMLITDTCSSPSRDLPESALKRLAEPRERKRQNYPSDLFLKHEGFLDITAASPGQFAIAHDDHGGHFTIAMLSHGFTEIADADNDNFLSWQEAFEKSKTQTQTLYAQAEFDAEIAADLRGNRQTTQTPEEFSLPVRTGGSGGGSAEVHALLIILGNDRMIRDIVEKNEDLMVTMLKQLSDDCSVKLTVMKSKNGYQGEVSKITYVNQKSSERKTTQQDIIESRQVARWLENLKPKPEDTVLIYYTGHGEADPQSRQLYLNFDALREDRREDRVKHREIVKSIEASKARLKILIMDTDSVGPSVTDTSSVRTFDMPNRSLSRIDTLRHLFLEHQGFLYLTAATEGEYAFARSDVGSFFTNALVTTISDFRDLNDDNFASWEEVFNITRQRTMKMFEAVSFSTILKEEFKERGITNQRPKYYGELPRRF